MDHLHERLDTLEQHVQTLTEHTHTVTRQLRWWRGIACGLAVLGLLGWGLPLGLAREDGAEKDKDQKKLEQRVADLEKLLKHVSREGKEIFITGANLHIVNGLGSTDCGSEEEPIPDCPNGLGNLIVGYNEPRPEGEGEIIRTGSHNVVVGRFHNFSRFGGLVVGSRNTISGNFSSVSGGSSNTAGGDGASVSGGNVNTASGGASSVSGGEGNTASGGIAVVSGGLFNTASGFLSSVSGGQLNAADGRGSSVSGGDSNMSSGSSAVVSGGGLNTASGDFSSVSGGANNTASGISASVSGGQNITQETENGWAAGSEGDEVVEGNFRAP